MADNDDIRGPAEVIRAMVSMFDTGQVDRVAEIVDANHFDHQDGISGPDGFEKVVAGARSRYTTLDVTVEDLIETTDRVAVRLRWLGTRPSGQVDERETIDIVRTANGRAIEHWGGRS